MKIKKRNFRNNFKYLNFLKRKRVKKITIISFLSLILLISLYYLISFFSVSSFNVCLERLKRTYNNDVICRDICFKERREYWTCLKKDLKKNNKNFNKIKDLILDEKESLEFRKDLIKVISNSNIDKSNLDFLHKYFLNEDNESEIKKEIIYSNSFNNKLVDYFYILENNFSYEVKKAAILKISSWENKKEYKLDHLNKIEQLIFSDYVNYKVRQDLVLLLASFKDNFSEEVISIWEKVYNANFLNDNISRAFAADFLGKEEVKVEESEWENYFTN